MSDRALPSAADHWILDPEVVFLNHGSFGACPRPVLAAQTKYRERMERQPLRFLHRELEDELDAVRLELATFLGADVDGIALVPNATTGVNTVLRCLSFEPGDKILITDHGYNACRNALDYVAERSAAEVIVVPLPFPIEAPEQVTAAILDAADERTKLALIDHVTSPTGLVLPIAEIVAGLAARGIDSLVDGAHAPGMLELDISDLGAAYYTGNCHKWLCSPKGSAFLHVREDRRAGFRPLVISHGANSPRRDRSRFLLEAGWTGTSDPSAWLSLPVALQFMASLCPGGWPEVRKRNRDLVLHGRQVLCQALEIPAPCPESMIGSLASLPLVPQARGPGPLFEDPLQVALRENHGIEVPVMPWPEPPHRLLRISAQIYNAPWQYEQLADALRRETQGKKA